MPVAFHSQIKMAHYTTVEHVKTIASANVIAIHRIHRSPHQKGLLQQPSLYYYVVSSLVNGDCFINEDVANLQRHVDE